MGLGKLAENKPLVESCNYLSNCEFKVLLGALYNPVTVLYFFISIIDVVGCRLVVNQRSVGLSVFQGQSCGGDIEYPRLATNWSPEARPRPGGPE
jgi:hypothetical protein